jgi:hypothetical protein
MLNCSEAELYRLIREGRIKSFKERYIRRISVKSIRDYIEEMLQAPDPLRGRLTADLAKQRQAQPERRQTNTQEAIRGA